MSSRKKPTDAQIALKCVTCKQGKWDHGQHVCCRKKCKYETSKTSSYFKDK